MSSGCRSSCKLWHRAVSPVCLPWQRPGAASRTVPTARENSTTKRALGKPQARLLRAALGKRLLVGGGVRHGDGGAIDDLDGASLPVPACRGLVVGLLAGAAGQASEHALGETLACLAVSTGVGGAGRQPPGSAPGEEPCDGSAAAVVGVEDLGKEDPGGHDRGEESLAEDDLLLVEGLRDLLGRQEIGEGQSRCLGELSVQSGDWACVRRGGTMSHGWPPGERM